MTSQAANTGGRGVQTGIGPTIPSWQLRAVVVGAIVLLLATIVVALDASIPLLVVLAVASIATVAHPRSHAPTVVLVLVVVAALTADGPGWWLPALVFGSHAMHLGSSLAATVPLAADVEVAALVSSARRFVGVQAVAQAVVVLVVVLTL